MARTLRDDKLDNRTARLKLPRRKWHQATLEPGLALRYRRTRTRVDSWYARVAGAISDARIGLADYYADADGKNTFDWKQAQARAREIAKRGPTPSYTVAEAVTDYLAW